MNQAGMTAPCAALRLPVSISWFISTLTSVESPTMLARIFIGSAMSSSASAECYFDFLGRDVILAVGLHQRDDIRALPHLDPGADRRIGACGDVERRRQHVGVFLDQDRDRFGVGNVATDPYGHYGAVLRDVGRLEENDVLALRRLAAAQRVHRLKM